MVKFSTPNVSYTFTWTACKPRLKELKSEVSDLNTTVKNLEYQLHCQEQYSHRNCVLVHGITETEGENTDDISLRKLNEPLELELTENKLDCTHRIGNPKLNNKRPKPIIAKFVHCNPRRKFLVNKRS